MKKILILTLTLLLPLAVFAQGKKPLTKWQQNLQKRNEQTIQRLQMQGLAYNRMDKAEVKERIAQSIDREINHWYMENMQTINKAMQEEAMKDGKESGDIFTEEYANKTKQTLVAEIKAGKIPELMLKTVSPKFAEQIKQRSEMQAQKQNEQQKGKRKPAKV